MSWFYLSSTRWGCESVAKWEEKGSGRKRGRERIRFLERWQLNEAIDCGTDGEWLQTQGNYFLAGGMEGARAPSLTGCSLLMDRGDGHTSAHAVMHSRACSHRHAHIHSKLFNQSKFFLK